MFFKRLHFFILIRLNKKALTGQSSPFFKSHENSALHSISGTSGGEWLYCAFFHHCSGSSGTIQVLVTYTKTNNNLWPTHDYVHSAFCWLSLQFSPSAIVCINCTCEYKAYKANYMYILERGIESERKRVTEKERERARERDRRSERARER